MVELVFEEPNGDLHALVLDAVPSEQHHANAVATEHEVEAGVSIADHVRPQRRALQITVVVSDTPLRATDALGGDLVSVDLDAGGITTQLPAQRRDGRWEAGGSEQRGRTVKAAVFAPASKPARVRDAWRQLVDARDRSLLAIVTTSLETYEDMVLIEVATTRTATDGTWLQADLSFVQLRQASTSLVADPVPARPRNRRPENDGSREAEESDPPLQSVLSQIADGGLSSLFEGL